MKILLCLPELPFPEEKDGFSLIMYSLVVHWALKHEITLYYFGNKDVQAECFFKKLGCSVIYQALIDGEKSALNILLKNPFKILQPRSCWGFLYKKSSIPTRHYFDLAIFARFESIYLSQLMSNISYSRSVFFELDLISLLYLRMSKASCKPVDKMYNYLQYHLVRNTEKKLYKVFDRVGFVSLVDREYAEFFFPNYGGSKFFNIRNGVNLRDKPLERSVNSGKENIKIGFSGDFAYKPNLLAAHFIINEIIPELKTNHKDYTIILIGRNPDQHMLVNSKIDPVNLIVTGEVADPLDEISKLDIYFSPLFVGTGMKNKILNAMSVGVPIICSTISSDGITELQNGLNYISCDSCNAKDWIQKISHLVESDNTKEDFSSKTKKIIRDKYNWSDISQEFLLLSAQ
jgi:glycosyltransferase involved in cell wall biosynthesis